jgi:ribonuclease HI
MGVEIYTDGCALGNPGASGAGIVMVFGEHQKELIIPLGHGTNNTAELLAVIHALEALNRPCEVNVYSDSQWVVKCGSREWQRKANMDLWKRYNDASERHIVRLHWIRKDSHTLNKRAHILANKAANNSAMDLLGDAS